MKGHIYRMSGKACKAGLGICVRVLLNINKKALSHWCLVYN